MTPARWWRRSFDVECSIATLARTGETRESWFTDYLCGLAEDAMGREPGSISGVTRPPTMTRVMG